MEQEFAGPGRPHAIKKRAGVVYWYDDDGNVMWNGSHTFSYDSANRMILASLPGNPWHVRYDVHGERVLDAQDQVDYNVYVGDFTYQRTSEDGYRQARLAPWRRAPATPGASEPLGDVKSGALESEPS